MDKYEFLTELCAKLWTLPEDDVKRSVDYYSEMIDDRMEDGLSEAEAVAAIGDTEEIAKTILANASVSQPAAQPQKPARKLSLWEILLLILGFPVWGSLAISLAAVVFSVWISLWSVVISLYATTVALGTSALGLLIGVVPVLTAGYFGQAAILAGAALICAGLAISFFLLSNLAAKGMVRLTKLTFQGIRKISKRKEQAV